MINPKELVLSRAEMQFADSYTIDNLEISGKVLMENAGIGCSKKIKQLIKAMKFKLTDSPAIALFCGTGNNGGDGFVIARHLTNWGFNCTIYMLGSPDKMSPESRDNYEKCLDMEIKLFQLDIDLPELNQFGLIIDAIFGIGLSGAVRGKAKSLINHINNCKIMTIAIDIPSGVDADSGTASVSTQCYCTLTMTARKYGHLLGAGQRASGEIFVIDIGIPDSVFEEFPPQALLMHKENVIYPKRNQFSHKGDYGKIGIVAGSPGFSGAARMASNAALRAGGGLVTLLHSQGMETIFETTLLEVMTKPINSDLNKLAQDLEQIEVLLIGPGIGQSINTQKIVQFILMFWKKPLVIDADALNIIAHNVWHSLLNNPNIIITPHIGEFARLVKKPISDIQDNCLEHLNNFTSEYKCSVLLKSATTIYRDSDNLIFDNSGNDGLATGGSGDILAGILVSFLGQKLPLFQAATAASFLLGTTAEKLANHRKAASIIPTDIIEGIFKY